MGLKEQGGEGAAEDSGDILGSIKKFQKKKLKQVRRRSMLNPLDFDQAPVPPKAPERASRRESEVGGDDLVSALSSVIMMRRQSCCSS